MLTNCFVSLHMLQDIIGCITDVDYFLWPRNDIDRIECCLFSRWKKETGPFKRIQVTFFHYSVPNDKI